MPSKLGPGRPLAALLASTCLLAACAARPTIGPQAASAAKSAEDPRFSDLSKRWLDGAMRLGPVDATQLGDHRFDNELDDLSPAGRERILKFDRDVLAELETIDVSKLSRENQVDAAILRNTLRRSIFSMTELQGWAWDPLLYNGIAGGSIYNLMAREFAPLPERLKAAAARMEKLPGFLVQARANLDLSRVPKVHAETVAKQNRGIISLVDELVVPNAGQLSGTERARLDGAIAKLREAVSEHQKWIEEVLLPGAKGQFRLGKERYDQKLALSLSSPLSREEIRRRAEAELMRVRADMYEIARKVLAGKPGSPELPEQSGEVQQQKAIEAALELAYADRPARDAVVDVAKQTLAEATAFVRAKNLVTVPDDPIKIILMPEFQRGVSVAYCDSPGPMDRELATYYAVSPIPSDWTKEQVDSFLREYNTRMLHLLSIHEAMPGHYLEGAHSNRHPSLLRAVLRSGPFAEGWAVYTEDVLADAGYLGGDPLFRLVQLKFYLRAVANAILDQGVHVDGWSREQAMDLMVRKTFQQEREAAGKWIRAQVTSTQLPTYFVGAQEHFDLRRAVEAREGAKFDAKRYHDTVLSYGAPPVRHVRQLMLDEPIR